MQTFHPAFQIHYPVIQWSNLQTNIIKLQKNCSVPSIYLLHLTLPPWQSAPRIKWFQVSGLSKPGVQHQRYFLSVYCPWLKGHMNIGGEEAIKVCTCAAAQMNEYWHTLGTHRGPKHKYRQKDRLKHTKITPTYVEKGKLSLKNRTSIAFCCGIALIGNIIILRIHWKLCSITTLHDIDNRSTSCATEHKDQYLSNLKTQETLPAPVVPSFF